jgi:putative ABC transport system permease protein
MTAALELRQVSKVYGSGPTEVPGSFVGPAALRSKGWERIRAGWFIETASPLTGAQRSAAGEMAVAAGLTIEARNDQASLSNLRTGATAAGMLLALGVLAMTVGLIRSEAAGDLRTLAATGASSTIRRTLTATTAGALALLGVLLGTAGAYLVLIGAYFGHLGHLSRIPVLHLTVTAVGVPLLAAASGWLLAGREPPAIARPALA